MLTALRLGAASSTGWLMGARSSRTPEVVLRFGVASTTGCFLGAERETGDAGRLRDAAEP